MDRQTCSSVGSRHSLSGSRRAIGAKREWRSPYIFEEAMAGIGNHCTEVHQVQWMTGHGKTSPTQIVSHFKTENYN